MAIRDPKAKLGCLVRGMPPLSPSVSEGCIWGNGGSDASTGPNQRRGRAVYRYDSYSDGVSRGLPVGRRTEMWDASGRTRWTWDQRGRVALEERWIDGKAYTTQWTYDALDRVSTMTYPDGEVVSYTDDEYGRPSGMTAGGVTILSDVVYGPTSLVQSAKLSKVVADLYLRYKYNRVDASTGLWPWGALWSVRLEKAGNALLEQRYEYDRAGNLLQLQDLTASEDFSYEYDDLDRLLVRKITGGSNQEWYAYDKIGNITSKNGAGWSYGTARPHAVESSGTGTYEYDNNGNMTRKGSSYLKYDPENRLVKVSANAGGTQYIARFSYDGDGKRVKRVDGGGTVHYVGSHYERNVGTGQDTTQTVTKFYYATLGTASRLIGLRRQGTFYYVCTDRLGSTAKVVNEDGTGPVSSLWYHAFGADRGSADSLGVDKRYTGQTADQSIGLYFYGARYYDPSLGRFVSPDTIVPDYCWRLEAVWVWGRRLLTSMAG